MEEWETAIELGLKERGLIASGIPSAPGRTYREFNKRAKDDPSKPWPFLVALEANLFAPYEPLGAEGDKEFKKLKCKDGYMQDVFAVSQDIVSKGDLERMDKALKQARADIDAKMAAGRWLRGHCHSCWSCHGRSLCLCSLHCSDCRQAVMGLRAQH